jgi:hypothetical protein
MQTPPRDPGSEALVTFALESLAREPRAEVRDAYKWLFQATRGGEHAVKDPAGPRAWLDREWESLGPPLPGEPAVVALRPDGAVVRLNLRPYRAAGGTKERLLGAFVKSANAFSESPKAFESAWDELGRRLEASPAGLLTAEAWRALDSEMRAKNWPAVHHSEGYGKEYRPAYRVLTKGEAAGVVVAIPRHWRTPGKAPSFVEVHFQSPRFCKEGSGVSTFWVFSCSGPSRRSLCRTQSPLAPRARGEGGTGERPSSARYNQVPTVETPEPGTEVPG